MRHLFVFLLLMISGIKVYPQSSFSKKFNVKDRLEPSSKPIIDSAAVVNWPKLHEEPLISNDGKYFSYMIYNSRGLFKGSRLIVRSTRSLWEKEFVNAISIGFSSESNKFIFSQKDTLKIIPLGRNEGTLAIIGVSAWKQPNKLKGEWIAWQLKANENVLIIHNLVSGKEFVYKNVKRYDFDETGKSVIMENISHQLIWLNLKENTTHIVWSPISIPGKESVVTNYCFDKQGRQLAFAVETKISHGIENSIWYYNVDLGKSILKATDEFANAQYGLPLSPSVRFSNDGHYIYTALNRPPDIAPKPGYLKLDVWSYKDTILQSSQLNQGMRIDPTSYDAVIDLKSDRLIKLCTKSGDYVKAMPDHSGDFIVIGNNSNSGDRFWLNQEDSYNILSLNDGSRKPLKVRGRPEFSFSPDGTFLVYYDSDARHYFSYNLSSGKLSNISSKLSTGYFARHHEYFHPYGKPTEADLKYGAVGQADWLKDKVLVYDDYDIWQLDLNGIEKPLSMTNGYGRRHKIKFRLIGGGIIDANPLLLTAFNMDNKENGYYRMNLKRKADPELLVMQAATFFHSSIEVMNALEFNKGMAPLKATKANKWVVMRQSAKDSPNFFITNDFKNYTALTNIYPEKTYNWIQTELIDWKQSDGNLTQGVLYKPEDFDPRKKYPVIFIIYEQLSHRLNEYPLPDFSNDVINIPWFVSRGYLVFTPDIHFTTGAIGGNALKTVVSGAKAISKFPFVDASSMAIVGHSYSGQMIYHVITHTNLFAAAIASAGVSDQISGSLQLNGIGVIKSDSRLQNAENRLGASLWERPDLYQAEMPVLKANQVTTPLVILHSITDGLPWEQAVEMFISLRRNGKKTWMLQYEEAGHTLAGMGKLPIDYTKRIEQFFNHYLKRDKAPSWMTSGIRAEHKGIQRGLQIDSNGVCGQDCKICVPSGNKASNIDGLQK